MSRIDTGTQYLIRRGPNASRARHRRLLAFVLVALPHLGLIWLATRPDPSHPQPPSGRGTPEAGPAWSKDDAPPVPVEPWQQVNARFAKA
jgi:hypothetical protein